MNLHLDQRLRLQLLRVVNALDTHGSLLKASAALGVSQPALTKSLKDIESITGLRLFERHARGVRATSAGQVMVRASHRILAELHRTEEELASIDKPDSDLAALGALPVAAAGIMPAALALLRQRQPNTKVRLEQGSTAQLLPLLAAGQIDLIVGRIYDPMAPDDFEREPLWLEPMALIGRYDHPIFALPAITRADINRYDLALPNVSQRIGMEIEHIVVQLAQDVRPVFRSSSHGFIRETLLSSDTLSIMPSLLVLGDLHRGYLRGAPIPVPTQPRRAGITYRKGRPLPAAALAFADALRTYIREIEDQGLVTITERDTQPGVA